MEQEHERHAGELYGDAIPGGGWSCRQTYIRNHIAIDAALRCSLRLRRDFRGPLRILDLGGGVIEPFLVAALVRVRFPDISTTIHLVDPSEDVVTLLQAIRHDTRWERECQGKTIVGFEPGTGVLPLRSLATIFSSPESPINPHLAEPDALRAPMRELDRLGVLAAMGLPNDAEKAISVLQSSGLPVPHASISMIEPLRGSVLDMDAEAERYDVIVANFSVQYPIVEGHADAVAARLFTMLKPDGVIQHGATYGAQVRLLHALCVRGAPFDVAFGVREVDKVVYVDDTEAAVTRLRIRTDAILTQGSDPMHARSLRDLLPSFPESKCVWGSPCELSKQMDSSDGLTRPRLTAMLGCGDGGIYGAWWSDRNELLTAHVPLWSRIEWRE